MTHKTKLTSLCKISTNILYKIMQLWKCFSFSLFMVAIDTMPWNNNLQEVTKQEDKWCNSAPCGYHENATFLIAYIFQNIRQYNSKFFIYINLEQTLVYFKLIQTTNHLDIKRAFWITYIYIYIYILFYFIVILRAAWLHLLNFFQMWNFWNLQHSKMFVCL